MFISVPPDYNDPVKKEKIKYYRELDIQKKEIIEYAASLGFVVYSDRSDKYANSDRARASMQPKGNDYIQFVKKDPENPEKNEYAMWYPGQGKYLHRN